MLTGVEDLGALVNELDLPSLRAGTIHRVRLELVEDGAGFPVSLPVLVARGRHDGPTLGIIAATHGDEINGIPVIHQLFGRIEPTRLSGTVIGVLVVNYPGFDRNKRRYLDGADLNHIMPGRKQGNASQLFAHRLLVRVIQRFNYLIDLHTASVGRVNSLYARADLDAETSRTMAHLVRPHLILHSPPHDGTIRGAATEIGIPSVTLEIGNPLRFQPEFIRTSLRGIRAVMNDLGMIKTRPRPSDHEPIVCRKSFWAYTDRGGLLTVHPNLLDRLKAGEPLATMTNIYGDVTAEYAMPEDGVIIGKSVNPVGYTGARIAHIGLEGDRT